MGLSTALAQESTIDPGLLRAKALQFLAPLPDKMPGAEKDSPALVTSWQETLLRKAAIPKRIRCTWSVGSNSGSSEPLPKEAFQNLLKEAYER